MGIEVLSRIKRLVARRQYRFSFKALDELDADGLTTADAIEAVLNAQVIQKTLRSRSRQRGRADEMLYVIESFTYSGTLLYTKGKIAQEKGEPVFYFFISAKARRHHT